MKGAPNENYAREVMELFSLGVGNYTEKDMQEAARAFTGWHHDAEGNEVRESTRSCTTTARRPSSARPASGPARTSSASAATSPPAPKFLVGKLYTYLVSETAPPQGLLEPLVASFRKSDYDIAALVRTMLALAAVLLRHAYRKRVKWPVEYALGAVRAAVPGRVPLADLVDPLAKMGQVLFNPPNVKGWRTGTDWLNSATLLARNNFAETVAMGDVEQGRRGRAVTDSGRRSPNRRRRRSTKTGSSTPPAAAGRESGPGGARSTPPSRRTSRRS